MPILSAVGTLSRGGLLRSFFFPCSPWDSRISGRINQGQHFSLLLGQGLGQPLYSPSLSGFLLLPVGFLLPVPIQKHPICLLHQFGDWISGPFPSLCNFLLMSGAAWVMKEWVNRTLPFMLFRSAWVKFLKASVSLPQKRAGFSFSPCVISFILL